MISFFEENIKYTLKNKKGIKNWLIESALSERKNISSINYIFCDDDYLLQLNSEYLDHNYYTDILTFPSSDSESHIEGDIFISIDRVRDNAISYQKPFLNELYRVMVHGLLHLCGYDDQTELDKLLMTSKEDTYLSKIIT